MVGGVRLFVAVFPPEEARSDLRRRLAGGLRTGRLTPIDRWHITLHFLGEVPDERRAEIENALDTVPMRGERPRLRLAGGGSFGTDRSTAQWAGVEGDVDALAALHDAVTDALGADRTTLIPHLTVGYARGNAVCNALDGYAGPEWTADELVLVRSHFGQGGGYENLRAWPI
jgi:RNA 2',3'-cyclic 3'-phosphodiesterase